MAAGDGHINFTAFGEARPQGSKAPVGNGRVESEALGKRGTHKAWRAMVATEAQLWATKNGLTQPIDGPDEVTLVFWKKKPKSYPRWRWLWWTTPDADKLTRSVLDSMSKIIMSDDALVSVLHVFKYLSTTGAEGVEVTVRPLSRIEKGLGEWWAAGNLPPGKIPDVDDPLPPNPDR